MHPRVLPEDPLLYIKALRGTFTLSKALHNESKTQAVPQTHRCLLTLGRDLVKSILRCNWESPGISQRESQGAVQTQRFSHGVPKGSSAHRIRALLTCSLGVYLPLPWLPLDTMTFGFIYFFLLWPCLLGCACHRGKKKAICREWCLIISMNRSCRFPCGEPRA